MAVIVSEPTENVRVCENTDSRKLIIAFSHVGYPVGKFAMSREVDPKILNASVIYVNCYNNSWYQAGVNSRIDSICKTANFLESLIDQLNPQRIVTVGMSMGAYGAVLFGCLLKVDAVIAITPELIIGEHLSRSLSMNIGYKYDHAYFSLHHIMAEAKGTHFNILYGCYDLNDLSLLWPSASLIEDKPDNWRVTFCGEGHKLPLSIDVGGLVRNSLSRDILEPEQIRKSIVKRVSHTRCEIMGYALAQRLRRVKRNADAIALLLSIESIVDESWTLFFVGTLYRELGEMSKAMTSFLTCLERDRTSFYLNQSIGLFSQEVGDVAAARELYKAALLLKPGDDATQKLLARSDTPAAR